MSVTRVGGGGFMGRRLLWSWQHQDRHVTTVAVAVGPSTERYF